jgi:hypothetical protein
MIGWVTVHKRIARFGKVILLPWSRARTHSTRIFSASGRISIVTVYTFLTMEPSGIVATYQHLFPIVVDRYFALVWIVVTVLCDSAISHVVAIAPLGDHYINPHARFIIYATSNTPLLYRFWWSTTLLLIITILETNR